MADLAEATTGNPSRLRRWAPALAILVLFFTYLAAHRLEPVCFDDCLGYVPLMGKSIFTRVYWSEWHGMFRAFSIPFIFSWFGELSLRSARAIVAFQILVSFAAWTIFVASLQRLTRSRGLRWTLATALLPLMFGRGYFHFNQYLLSDSLAQSFLLLWFALVIHAGRIQARLKHRPRGATVLFFILFAAFTLLASFTRDANLFLILLAAVPISGLAKPPDRRFAGGMILVMVAVAALHARASANRGRWSMFSALGHHVLIDEGRTAYFAARGMPSGPEALRYRGGDFSTPGIQSFLGPFIWSGGRKVYAQYLITHPAFVASTAWKNSSLLFDQVFSPTPPVPDHPKLESPLPAVDDFPRWPEKLSILDQLPLAVLLGWAGISALILAIRRAGDPLTALGGFFFLAGGSNSLIAYFADAMAINETQRHCFIGSIWLRVGCGILICQGLVTLGQALARRRAIRPTIAQKWA